MSSATGTLRAALAALVLALPGTALGNGSAILVPPVREPHAGQVEVRVLKVQTSNSERSGCRVMINIYNATPSPISFAGLLNTYSKDNEPVDVWFISAADLKPYQATERIFTCSAFSEMLTLNPDSPTGWPGRCAIASERVEPCALKVKLESNLPVQAAPPRPKDAPAAGGKGGGGKH